MKFSIIIPTINRHLELQTTLDTIYASSILPSEILIIDQSDNQETQKILIKNRYERIHYIKQDIKSSAIARNFAIDNLDNHSDLVFFLDDDISIDYYCFERVIKYMNINQNTKGGLLNIYTPSRNISFVKKVGFFLLTGSIRFKEQFVTRGGFNAMFLQQPIDSKQVQRCSGCGMFFRKKIFDEGFRFPYRFMKYSLMEDVFFTYSIYKKYSDGLVYLPDCKIVHHESPNRTIPIKAKIMQNIIHRYLFIRHFRLSFFSYIWTIFLLGILDFFSFKKFVIILWYIKGLWYVYINRYSLDIDGSKIDYNKFIFK